MFYTLDRNSATIKSRCPVCVFVDCLVCGFSLDSPGFCPACGSENEPSEINSGRPEQAELDVIGKENIEIPKDELGPASLESSDSDANSTIQLLFGIDDAPTNSDSPIIPYGLDFAPSFAEN